MLVPDFGGPTPEEGEYAAYQAAFEKMFVTVTMWATVRPGGKVDEGIRYVIPVLPDRMAWLSRQ